MDLPVYSRYTREKSLKSYNLKKFEKKKFEPLLQSTSRSSTIPKSELKSKQYDSYREKDDDELKPAKKIYLKLQEKS